MNSEKAEGLPNINFVTFIISLASSVQVHLGAIPDPLTKKTETSLPHAKQTLDILEMLQEKTKGNLDDSETKLLDHILYELRLQYVECSKSKDSGDKEGELSQEEKV